MFLIESFAFFIFGIIGVGLSGGFLSGSWLIVGLSVSGIVGLLGVAGLLKSASEW